ncbi:MAG: hypothetical protein PHU44_16525 [Syntrophales bacterium]|nr:hypothetical protein [Syntrophales bacterium]MDD5642625.1 hypothetical protein [Syntrophales bacterium]
MNFKGKAGILGLVLLLALATGAQAKAPSLAWDGTQWKEFNQQIKVAYIKGVLNMAAFETAMGGSGRSACVSRAFTEELKTKTLGQVIAEVDKFYKENPGKMKTPVIEVVMQRCTKLCPPEPAAKGGKK